MAGKVTSKNLASANLAVSTISSAVSTAVSIAALTALLNKKGRKTVSRNYKQAMMSEEEYELDTFMCARCHNPIHYDELPSFYYGGCVDYEVEYSPSDCGYEANYSFTCPFCNAENHGVADFRPLRYTTYKITEGEFDPNSLNAGVFDASALYNRKGRSHRAKPSKCTDHSDRIRQLNFDSMVKRKPGRGRP